MFGAEKGKGDRLDGKDLHIGIVQARFNESITDTLAAASDFSRLASKSMLPAASESASVRIGSGWPVTRLTAQRMNSVWISLRGLAASFLTT